MEDILWDYSYQYQRQQNRTIKAERELSQRHSRLYLQSGQECWVSRTRVHHVDVIATCGAGHISRHLSPVTPQFPLQRFLAGTFVSAARCMHGTSGHLFTCSLSYDQPHYKMFPSRQTCGAWSGKAA